MATVTIDIDLPAGVEVTCYERHGEGHGFQVTWALPDRCRCDRCHKEEPACIEFRDNVLAIRDLDIWGQPSFFIYQPPYHRCPWCNYRQFLIPPFKRKDVHYTYRFEKWVLRLLIGSNEEEVARRLGIAAETVALIVRRQLADAKPIDPSRVITDVGMDEFSLKKRHKLYVTVLTDLSNPDKPEVLAVASGRDEAAGQACLERLSAEQREQVRTYRVDMGQPLNNACAGLLKKAHAVTDRFHVAKKFNEVIDAWRKKNHSQVQGQAVEERAQGFSFVDVGIPARSADPVAPGAGETPGPVRAPAAVGEAVPAAGAVQGDL
jgi:transposase